ncbi:MAG: diacylglycerol kinase family protein [Elusimicrobiota bacterium]|nr:diacylglycerol kinase family protein [Elusimicrobiota bacterium]
MLNSKVIINPSSGRGKGALLAPRIARALDIKEEDIVFADNLADAGKKAEHFAMIGVNPVIFCGGDGMLGAVLNGVLRVSSNVAIGIIPAGMSDVAALSLGIPRRFEDAVGIIKRGKTRRVDSGVVIHPGGKRYFYSMADFGFTADIVRIAENNLFIKKALGKKAHYVAGFYKLLARKKFFDITCGDYSGRSFQAIFMNGLFWGGGFRWGNDFSQKDGTGDLLVFERMNILRLINILSALVRGREIKGLTRLRTSSAFLKSERPVPWHADGEFMGFLREAEIKILPASAQFLCEPDAVI